MDCPCKKTAGVKDAETLNSCICVGRKTAEFWLDRCAGKYHARRISQQEALDIDWSYTVTRRGWSPLIWTSSERNTDKGA